VESDNYFDPLNQLHRRLNDLDERGLVLTLAAFAEDSLAELLTAYMLDNPATKKLVGGFDAPLGTLSARIRACYALGLITKGQYHDLEHLRSVRNKFSHTWEPISFDDQEVKKHIKAMHYSNLVERFPETLREKIENSISVLLLEIKIAIGKISKSKALATNQGSRIYSGLNGSTEEQIQKCREKLKEINSEIKGAKAEYKEFLANLKRLWLEKYHRASSNGSKEQFEINIKGMLDFASQEEVKYSYIYNRNL
jgi:DNA-binding MltR family transcriptional regulator